jgi:hypothetical protein
MDCSNAILLSALLEVKLVLSHPKLIKFTLECHFGKTPRDKTFNPNWTDFDLKLQENLFSTGFFNTCRNVFQIFLNFWHDLNKLCFDVHFDVFLSKVRRGATLLTLPLPPNFTAITEHPRAWEFPPDCGPHSSMVPVRIPTGFWSQALKSGGGSRFSIGPGLSPFLSEALAAHRSGQMPKTGSFSSTVTPHTRYPLHGLGSFNLDLIGLLLLVRKWGLILPHPVCEVASGSRFILGL